MRDSGTDSGELGGGRALTKNEVKRRVSLANKIHSLGKVHFKMLISTLSIIKTLAQLTFRNGKHLIKY